VRLTVLAGLVAGGVALKQTVLAPKPVAVRVVAVGKGPVESTVTNSRAGTVKARRRAKISPEIGGRVVEISRPEGERVEEGEVLLRLDDSIHKARVTFARRSLEAAQAQHAEALVRMEQAERELKRNRLLARRKIITVDLLEKFNSAHEAAIASSKTAGARVEQAQAEVGLALAELVKTIIHAPFSGVLADVSVEVGEWVTPAPPLMPVPSVLDLIDTSSIYVSAPMDEVDSAVIKTGQRVRVTLDPFPKRSFLGRVVLVASYVLDVQAQNRTVEIEVELDDREFAAKLLPGTSADVEVILETREDVLRIPSSTLMEGRKVLVFEGGGLVERQVEVGLKNWNYTEILSGLTPGERVVSSLGKVEVKAGAVAVVESSSP
jgi:HlyD family secretion protein